jgi:hypothetical protein
MQSADGRRATHKENNIMNTTNPTRITILVRGWNDTCTVRVLVNGHPAGTSGIQRRGATTTGHRGQHFALTIAWALLVSGDWPHPSLLESGLETVARWGDAGFDVTLDVVPVARRSDLHNAGADYWTTEPAPTELVAAFEAALYAAVAG